ncbi:ABC transporter ATP-binding protein [Halobium palmae]|uniref:ABC transporter ATP-binding protein n=1 Tax=Halobium palmae TaxID=1776492 RepID=A0ABD5RWB4_9EURY
MTDKPVLEVDDLSIRYETRGNDIQAVSDASFSIDSNDFLGLVGESGCGKSTIAQSIIGALDANGQVDSGRIMYKGTPIQNYTEEEFNREVRWSEISFIPQSAMNSLDPTRRIASQALELAHVHTDWSKDRALNELREMFETVGLPRDRVNEYPYQFSGGMKQRAVIALSLFLQPSLVIADEPTTALDVIMQDQILEYFNKIKQEQETSLLLITHDISVVFETCDSMAIMHGGQVAESGRVSDIHGNPRHPYSILLQGAFPDIRQPNKKLQVIEGDPPVQEGSVDHCTFANRCPWAKKECRAEEPPLVEMPDGNDHRSSCIRWDEIPSLSSDYLDREEDQPAPTQSHSGSQDEEPLLELRGMDRHFSTSANLIDELRSLFGNGYSDQLQAVDDVDMELRRNEVQGIIGESGCGKSTLLRTVMGIHQPTGGELIYKGTPMTQFSKEDWNKYRKEVQIIFQDPFNSFNPQFTVRDILREPLKIHDQPYDDEFLRQRLSDVHLNPPNEYLHRRASRLSGGEKQRVAIAKALVLDPEIILADEPVSMLDVSTQAAVLNLLDELTEKHGIAMFYVSHDLSTVSYICQQVNVMYLGRVIERAPTSELLEEPKHPYTSALIDAIPIPDPQSTRAKPNLSGTPSDPIDLPTGCRFKDRCPKRMDICEENPQNVAANSGGDHQVACHLYYDHHEKMTRNQEINSNVVEQD